MSAVRIQSENKNGVKWKKIFFIVLALTIILILFLFDTPIWQAARDLVEPDYLYIPKLLSHWGLYLFYAIFAGFWIYAFIRKNRKFLNVGLAYLKAQIIFSLVVVRIIKVVLGRARPGYDSEFTFFETTGKYNAFPSGHSADAFVSGVFLYYLLKQTRYAAFRFLPLIYAFLIALSRVFVSAHYPSDVAAGITIGILGAWFFIYRSQQNGN
jgi:membrane-associated phospholipid phosphatase